MELKEPILAISTLYIFINLTRTYDRFAIVTYVGIFITASFPMAIVLVLLLPRKPFLVAHVLCKRGLPSAIFAVLFCFFINFVDSVYSGAVRMAEVPLLPPWPTLGHAIL